VGATQPSAGSRAFKVISAVPFANPFTWYQIEGTAVQSRLIRDMASAASAMTAFDTWVSNLDRRYPGNLLVREDVTSSPVRVQVAYIDYASSMSRAWQDEAWRNADVVGLFPPDIMFDLASAAESVGRIEKLPDGQIREVVTRIPESFLHADSRELILAGLLDRKQRLLSILQTVYPGLR